MFGPVQVIDWGLMKKRREGLSESEQEQGGGGGRGGGASWG